MKSPIIYVFWLTNSSNLAIISQISRVLILIIFASTKIGILLHDVVSQNKIILSTGVVQNIVISEIDALLQKWAALVGFDFADDSVCLPCNEQSNEVIVDWCSYLLLCTISHLNDSCDKLCYVISITKSFPELLVVLNL